METIELLSRYRSEWLIGLGVTLKLCLIVWATGVSVGAFLAFAGHRFRTVVELPVRLVSFVLGAVPALVFLMWLHYPAQTLIGINVPPFYTAAFALSVLNVLAVFDIVRGPLRDFPGPLLDAALVSGLSRREIMLRIQLPIIARQCISPLLFLQVAMLHASLLASLISVDEIFRIAQRINSEVYRPVQVYTVLAAVLFAVCAPLHLLAFWIRQRVSKDVAPRRG